MRKKIIYIYIFTLIFFFISASFCSGKGESGSYNRLNYGSISIPLPVPIIVSLISKKNVSCNGGNDGEIKISVSGGIPPYTFQWSNGDTTQNVSDLSAGNYYVIVMDSIGATVTFNSSIYQYSAIFISVAAKSDVDCFGNNTGSIDINVAGGISPYSYSWSNGATTQDINELFPGFYTVNVLDSNSCLATISVSISQPNDSLNPVISSIPATDGNCNGSVSVNASGGIPPYTYEWFDIYGNPLSNTDSLCVGVYFVKITDSNGCIKNAKAVVSDGSTAINESNHSNLFSIFPNPATETLIISLSLNVDAYYEIFDLTGGVLERNKILFAKQNISLKNYCPGIYFLKISDGEKKHIYKFLKQE